MKKIRFLILKEWSEIFRNKFVLFSVAFLPLIFTILPLAILYGMTSSGDMGSLAGMEESFSQATQLCGNLVGGECAQYLIVTQFIMLFMMLPAIIPITVASYSIVGEKTTRTLEPILATPITTMELLAGKGLAAVIPAVAATWVGYTLYAVGAALMNVAPAVVVKLFDPLWLLAVVVVGPLLAIAGVSIAVMISSRTSDPRVAEQISGLFILPLVGIFIGQSTGVLLIDQTLILWAAAVLLVLDGAFLAFAVQLFQRETILTRWK